MGCVGSKDDGKTDCEIRQDRNGQDQLSTVVKGIVHLITATLPDR